MPKCLSLLLCVFFTVSFAPAQTLSPQTKVFVKIDSPVVALAHVRVIDGTGAAAREDQTVVISKGKVESVSDAASASIPKDAQVLDPARIQRNPRSRRHARPYVLSHGERHLWRETASATILRS